MADLPREGLSGALAPAQQSSYLYPTTLSLAHLFQVRRFFCLLGTFCALLRHIDTDAVPDISHYGGIFMKKITAIVIAAALLLGLTACAGGERNGQKQPSASGAVKALAEAQYPKLEPYPREDDYIDKDGQWDDEKYMEDYRAWKAAVDAISSDADHREDMADFVKAVDEKLLAGGEGENRVCSPVNIYMALAMLSETTEGVTREQILDLLGADSVEQVRAVAGDVWGNNYRDDGSITSLLSASVWLRENIEPNAETLKTLAQSYYADVYSGDTADLKMTEAMQKWINDHTGGLLEEQASEEKLEADTVMALISAIYFKAGWQDEFYPRNNVTLPFHRAGGDVECEFMRCNEDALYRGEGFTAVVKPLAQSRSMYFILPNEGETTDGLLGSDGLWDFVMSRREWEDITYPIVHLSLPKFDTTSKTDLLPILEELGMTDILSDKTADFTPLTAATEPFLSQASHAARVKIDEQGVVAAAYTEIMTSDTAALEDPEEVDFTLDRPFVFVIAGADGLPLFTGVINDPTA